MLRGDFINISLLILSELTMGDDFRIGSRARSLFSKSEEDLHRISGLVSVIGDDNEMYNKYLEHLSAQLKGLKTKISEFKTLMNETVRLLKKTASSEEVQKVQQKAERIDFHTLLTREEFKKMLEEAH